MLRTRAADNDHSEEARLLLRDAVERKLSFWNLASIVCSHFGPVNGIDLELPLHEPPS